MKIVVKISILSYLIFNPFLFFSQPQFAESASQLGITFSYGNSNYGGGVSFVDFDNDGWDDISFTSQNNSELHFYKNNSGIFNRVILNGIENSQETKQIIWVDYDNDGDKDLFVAVFIGSNKFYRNDGNMNFVDISSTIGFFQEDLFTFSASFGDIDNDGDLDAFISNRDGVNEIQRNYLYRNDNGYYSDISEAAGIVMTAELSFCSIFFDYNEDGFQDIYVSNDKPIYRNRLYKNNGDGTFDDVSITSGAGIEINAMTTTLGDYNNDGYFDIYVTNTPQGNQLLKNNGDGTFVDVAEITGTTFDSLGWGAVFVDADNDGLEDLYVSGGFNGTVPPGFLSSAFYHNQGGGTFEIPENIGFSADVSESYSNAIGDVDNNGLPDIVVTNDTDLNYLWKNTTVNENNWLKVRLEGVTGNRDGIGNKIEVFSNGLSQYRYTLCGEGYLGQNSSYKFFGLGNATNVDYIKVTWKHNGVEEIINNIPTNQAIIIREGNGILNVDELKSIQNIRVYPNPSKDGKFTIMTDPNSIDLFNLELYDSTGRLIMKLSELSGKEELNISNCSKGVYLIKLSYDDHIYTNRLINN